MQEPRGLKSPRVSLPASRAIRFPCCPGFGVFPTRLVATHCVMAHVEIAASVSRPGLRSAAAAARAEVSGIESPLRPASQAHVPISTKGDNRAPFEQVVRVSQRETYESLMLLLRASFAEKLKAGSYDDLQPFCKVVQLSAKGSRDDLEGRRIAHHDDFV